VGATRGEQSGGYGLRHIAKSLALILLLQSPTVTDQLLRYFVYAVLLSRLCSVII
jgi:hypothetical protein